MKNVLMSMGLVFLLLLVSCAQKESQKDIPPVPELNLSCTQDPLAEYPMLGTQEGGEVDSCNAITSKKEQAVCYQTVLLQLFNSSDANIHLCDKISDNEAFFRCYLGFAQIKRDPCICGSIPNLFANTEELQAGCYVYSAIQFKEEKVCDKIKGAGQKIISLKANCYERIGRLKKDPEICKIAQTVQGNSDRSDTCLMYVAKSGKKPELCSDILNQSMQEKCFLQIAVDTEDESLCSKTTDQLLLQSCQSIIQEKKRTGQMNISS